MKKGKSFSKNTKYGHLGQIYGEASGSKLNWQSLRYKGKKFVKWNEIAPEDKLHEMRVHEFFQNRRKFKKENS